MKRQHGHSGGKCAPEGGGAFWRLAWRDLEGYAALLVPLAVMFLLFREQMLTTDRLASRAILLAVADAAVVLLPYWVLPRRWRGWCLAAVWLMAAWFFANAVYMRHFGDLIPLSSWRLTGNAGSLTLTSALSLVRRADVAWLLLPLAATAAVVLGGSCRRVASPRRQEPPSTTGLRKARLAIRVGAILATLLLFGAAQFHYTNLLRTHWVNTMAGRSRSSLLYMRYREYTLPVYEMEQGGFIVMAVKSLCHELAVSGRVKPLSDAERREVVDYLATRPASSPIVANRGKNLLVVIVESLNADVVGRVVGGDTITPTLNRLLASDGVVASLQVHSQVDAGGSSDGQLLYCTGLVPLQGEATVMSYTQNAWPSLARELGPEYRSVEVVVDSSGVWNHDLTTQWWGFSELYVAPCAEGEGPDGALFRYVSRLMEGMSSPWFMMVSTFSMHMPFYSYETQHLPGVSADKSLTANERRYLGATHYFDSELGLLLERMRRSGDLENTVVVIVSDHNVGLRESDFLRGVVEKRGDLVMLVAGAGEQRRLGAMSQMDVYPTLLDIMGVQHPQWRGVGASRLAPSAASRGSCAAPGGETACRRGEAACRGGETACRGGEAACRGGEAACRGGEAVCRGGEAASLFEEEERARRVSELLIRSGGAFFNE